MNKANLHYRSEHPSTVAVYDEYGTCWIKFKGADAKEKARAFIKEHEEGKKPL